jgi:hypothetical protein
MDMALNLKQRLMRKTQIVPSRWAQQCVVMGQPFPGPLSYRYHPWTEKMIDSEAEINVGMKAAQMGYSITTLCRSLYLIDIRKDSVLYLLPTKTPDATDFSATRFDPLLEASEHLQTLFSDVRNVGTKRAGAATLYIRGSNSRSGLKSIPVAAIMFDELDEMVEKNIPLARQRTAGQRYRLEWYISTPTVPGFGVHAEYEKTNKQHFFFRCPMCSQKIELLFENLIIPDDNPDLAYFQCSECQGQLTDPTETQEELTERKASWYEKGTEWVPENSKDACGWSVNQAYSCAVSGNPKDLADGFLDIHTSKSKEQEYWTSRWGLAHEVEGARISEELIISLLAKSQYRKQTSAPTAKLTTMGVDVGARLHIVVKEWTPLATKTNDKNLGARPRIIYEGTRPTTPGFPELDELMRNYNINYCVVDANPERSSAYAFAKRFWGWVSICFYGNGVSAAEILENEHRLSVTVDRTQWLDIALGRYSAGTIDLPQDLSTEFKKNLNNIVRIYEEDGHGNPIGRYVNNGPDHFAHADTYSEIALPLASTQ